MSAKLLFETPQLRLFVTIVGLLHNNVFLVQAKSNNESILFDAASDAPQLCELAATHNVTRVLQTHGHWDHIGAIPEMRQVGYEVGVAKGDAAELSGYDFLIEDGDTYHIGDITITAIATPGHTPGSTCFSIKNSSLLLTGDTLFDGGPGATHFPGGDHKTILSSINEKLFARFPDNTIVLPGHGASTTIGAEKLNLLKYL